MERGPPPGNATPRFHGGPRPIGALVPGVTRSVFRKQGPALAQLLADWPAIIGPALAATTAPRRCTAGTLTLACNGPVALELQHLAGPLMERINTYLGAQTVQRLRLVQDAAAIPRPAGPAPRRPAAKPPVAIPDFPDSPLRDALAALGARVGRDPA